MLRGGNAVLGLPAKKVFHNVSLKEIEFDFLLPPIITPGSFLRCIW